MCGAHGETPPTFVCCHVADGIGCGFHAGPRTADNPWPDAWCDRCDEAFQAAGGEWNDRNGKLADIKLICTHCYTEAKARNADVPALARGAAARLTNAEIARLLHGAIHHAQAVQELSMSRWGWEGSASWQFDSNASTLAFQVGKGKIAVADVRLVGSYSTRSNTFQWSWETFDTDAPEATEVERLRAFGEARGIKKLTTPSWKCDEQEGWEMAALAAYLLGSEGIYRAPFDHLRWFMLLSNWRIARPGAAAN